MGTALLVLRHQLFRDALRRLLIDAGFSITGEAPDLNGALALDQKHPLDFVIVDASFCNEESAFSRMREAVGGRIVILAWETDLCRIGSDHLMAADGILTFDISFETMTYSLRLIQSGERVVPRELVPHLLTRRAPSTTTSGTAPHRGLSPRETDMAHHLARGNSNKRIARALGITEATVKVHLRGVLRKLSVTNCTQAAIWAQQNGFGVESPPL